MKKLKKKRNSTGKRIKKNEYDGYQLWRNEN